MLTIKAWPHAHEREVAGHVPPRTVTARVTLRATKAAGEASDAYADNLSLILHSSNR